MVLPQHTKSAAKNLPWTACALACVIVGASFLGCRDNSPKQPVNTNLKEGDAKNAKLISPDLAHAKNSTNKSPTKTELAENQPTPNHPTLKQATPKQATPNRTANKPTPGSDDAPLVGPRILYDTMHLRHEIRHRGPLDLHPDYGLFRPNQFRKDHTLFVLAFDSVPRQNYFLNNYMYLLTDKEQRFRAMDLVESFNDRFRVLLEQRNEILEVASDQLDVSSLLLNNQVETLKLSRLLRRTIHREILTRDQRAKYTADFQEELRKREEVQAKKTATSKQP